MRSTLSVICAVVLTVCALAGLGLYRGELRRQEAARQKAASEEIAKQIEAAKAAGFRLEWSSFMRHRRSEREIKNLEFETKLLPLKGWAKQAMESEQQAYNRKRDAEDEALVGLGELGLTTDEAKEKIGISDK